MKNLDDVIKNNLHGLHYGNRVLIPFVADVLKAVIENDIIVDFSSTKTGAYYKKHEDFTEIYFYNYKNLEEVISQYETIKLVIVEKGKSIFDFGTHRKIALRLQKNHKLIIEELNDDILFVE